MHWSPQQEAALDAVGDWIRSPDKPFFYLAGYAGTGKTTLAKHFAATMDGTVLFGAFTGKAANVMREKGCHEATTLHKLIYCSREKSVQFLQGLQDQLKAANTEAERKEIRKAIRKEVETLEAPSFYLNPESPVRRASLLIIDECSMVDERMARDLLSFNTPILVLGDPAQLPPVKSAGYFTKGDPDFMLTEVHRQAGDSGILRLATMIRQGHTPSYGAHGNDALVVRREELDKTSVPHYDQIIVGRNKTRTDTNRRLRQILGRTSDLPEPGDKLVCLRNNHELGLLNGTIWQTLDAVVFDDRVGLTIECEGMVENVEAHAKLFRGQKLEYFERDREVQEFDYGYVLTCHKSQGSEWPRVIVFDESRFFRASAREWLYTAVTRANRELTLVR